MTTIVSRGAVRYVIMRRRFHIVWWRNGIEDSGRERKGRIVHRRG
jgi:hypothetical protein